MTLIFALSLLGLFDSAYLLWAYTSPSHAMVCLVGSGCDAVRASTYAHHWGLPLPVYGVVMYAVLAVLTFLEPWLGRASRVLLAAIAGAGFVASLYLTGLEAFVIHAWCAWCVVSALTTTTIFALTLGELRPSTLAGGADEAAGAAPVRSAARVTARLIGVLLVALAVGIPSFRYLSHRGEIPAPPRLTTQTLAEHLVRPDSHASGNPGAATVVEFGDFECPACRAAQPTVDAVRKKYGDRIRFVFRQFPLRAIHPQAEKAAEASECAAEQGKFWAMQEKLYAEQGDLSEPALIHYAVELGLDRSEFSRCLDTGATTQRVERDVADAHALGLRGTPAFAIGQRLLLWPIAFGQFSHLIDQDLAARGITTAQAAPQASPKRAEQERASSQPGRPRASAASGAKGAEADPSSADSLPNSSSLSSNSPGSLAGDASAFSQLGEAAPGCSEDEARKRQPALIRTAEARQLFENPSKALFVDVRSATEYASRHVRGAANVPVEQIQQRWSGLPKDKTIVFYESGKGRGDDICASGRAAGRVLLENGFEFKRVKVYQDGLAGWEKASLPVEP